MHSSDPSLFSFPPSPPSSAPLLPRGGADGGGGGAAGAGDAAGRDPYTLMERALGWAASMRANDETLTLLFLLLPILTLKAVCLFLLTEGRKATGQRDAAAARAAGRNAKRGGGLPTGGAESGAAGLCGGEDLGAALEEYLGRALLLVGCVLSLLRADASCALGLLATLGQSESRLYFSRALLGTALLALAVDADWLGVGGARGGGAPCRPALAGVPCAAGLAAGVAWLNPAYLWSLLLQGRLALLCTVLAAPLKLALLLSGTYLNYSQPAAPTRPFRFPEARRDYPRLPEITRAYPRLPEITRDYPRGRSASPRRGSSTPRRRESSSCARGARG